MASDSGVGLKPSQENQVKKVRSQKSNCTKNRSGLGQGEEGLSLHTTNEPMMQTSLSAYWTPSPQVVNKANKLIFSLDAFSTGQQLKLARRIISPQPDEPSIKVFFFCSARQTDFGRKEHRCHTSLVRGQRFEPKEGTNGTRD